MNSFELPCQCVEWDIRYLWTLVLKDWILYIYTDIIIYGYYVYIIYWFGNAHAGKAFHFFAVRVKKSFWNFDVRTVLKVTAGP